MVALQADKQAGQTASTCLHVVSLPRLQIPSDLTTAELDRATRRVLRPCAVCMPARWAAQRTAYCVSMGLHLLLAQAVSSAVAGPSLHVRPAAGTS